jgi:hypothetical protein
MSRARQSAPSKKKKGASKRQSSGITIRRIAKAQKHDVEIAHKTEAAVATQQLPRAHAHDYARERKKVAKRLRKTQDAYLSQSAVDLNTIDPGAKTLLVWCPRCRYRMSPEQVRAGFEESILDYRTKCPECDFRFETSFAFMSDGMYARFVWLCPDQTRDQYALWLEERVFDANIADVLLRDRPEIFFNAYRYSDESNAGVKARVCQFLEIP